MGGLGIKYQVPKAGSHRCVGHVFLTGFCPGRAAVQHPGSLHTLIIGKSPTCAPPMWHHIVDFG